MRKLLLACSLCFCACAANQKKQVSLVDGQPTLAPLDHSRCDPAGKTVVEVDLNQDKRPDVWRFYAKVLENGATVDVLTCRENDLNFDGKKDSWIFYDRAGNVSNEEFDFDFDGIIDEWTFRQNGKVVRKEKDLSFDGKADMWEFFDRDKLIRIERSSKRNGKVDVWEYYEDGKLDRIGYDTTGSGQIDRWERAERAEAEGDPTDPVPPTAAEASSPPAVAPSKGGAK
jgi:hypothetical protein